MAALGDENIGRLDVAMDDAFAVRGVESFRDLDSNFEGGFRLHRAPADTVLQRHPVHELHGDERLAGILADVVNGANVGMIERRRGLGFAPKPFEGLRVARQFHGKEFQGDETIQARILRFVDHAHTAAAELFDNAVMGNRAANKRRRIGHEPHILDFAKRPSQRTHRLPQCTNSRSLLQFRVFGFGLFQDGHVRVGVFPQREKILVGGAGFGAGGVGLGALRRRGFERVRAAEAETRERTAGIIPNNARIIQYPLKFGRGRRAVLLQ